MGEQYEEISPEMREVLGDFNADSGVDEDDQDCLNVTALNVCQEGTENKPDGVEGGWFLSKNAADFTPREEVRVSGVARKVYNELRTVYKKNVEFRSICSCEPESRKDVFTIGYPHKQEGNRWVQDLSQPSRNCLGCPRYPFDQNHENITEEDFDSKKIKGLGDNKCGTKTMLGLVIHKDDGSKEPAVLRGLGGAFSMKAYKTFSYTDENGDRWISYYAMVKKLGLMRLPWQKGKESGIKMRNVKIRMRAMKVEDITGKPYMPVFNFELPSREELKGMMVSPEKFFSVFNDPGEMKAIGGMVKQQLALASGFVDDDDEPGGQPPIAPAAPPEPIIKKDDPESKARVEQILKENEKLVTVMVPGEGLKNVTSEDAEKLIAEGKAQAIHTGEPPHPAEGGQGNMF